MKNIKHTLLQWAKIFLFCFVGTLIGQTAVKGVPLWDVPGAEDVRQVTVLCTVRGKEQTFADAENIELAVKMTSFLAYKPLAKPQAEEPALSITYLLTDGTAREVQASEHTVWWNGKAHALKDPGTALKLSEAIFYPYPEPQ